MENQKPAQKTIIITETQKKPLEITGLLLNLDPRKQHGFYIEAVVVKDPKQPQGISKQPLLEKVSVKGLKPTPYVLQGILKQLTGISAKNEQERLQMRYREDNITTPDPDTWVRHKMYAYFYNALQAVKPFASVMKWYYETTDEQLSTMRVVKPASISNYSPVVSIQLVRTPAETLRMLVHVNINENLFPLSDFKRHGFLLRNKNEFFLMKPEDAILTERYPEGFYDVPAESEQKFLQHFVPQLEQHYAVDRTMLQQLETIEVTPQCRIHLSELNGSFLMIRTRWQYGEFELDNATATEEEINTPNGRYKIIKDKTTEKETHDFIQAQHKKFSQQNNGYFYLPFADAEKSQWFVKFYRKLNDRNIPVYGMESMEHFRYNANRPVIQFTQKGKSIDWFDLTVHISYGDQTITLLELQKAIQNKQPFLLLKDGTLGEIPEEWQQQFGLLLQMGEIDKDKLRLSKLHWTLTEDLAKNGQLIVADKMETSRQKWERLQLAPQAFAVPGAIRATLRDYQQAGFAWFCMLDEMQWGGCLADDMGLGKTLQTISFLQYAHNKYPGETHLVICPTSLMYNWENELKKFAPELKYFIYHGTERKTADWKNYDIIISSYGSVRNDIDVMKAFTFGYIVLDESQVIKNPSSQVTIAMTQLQSRNRLILSGTPIQNNTFDLYAQMQFANPGLLGSHNFFKSNFAVPVDKYGDAEKTKQLRKLIYPFLLRRTKEQVAKDLPPKTEITLWCEMGEEQRRVYDELKNYYRDNLLDRIQKEGMGSNTILVLEGLTRLRQVCNSPKLLNGGQNDHTDESVKLEELLREIENNTGRHKALVFSQFTGMLQLIANAMKERNIPFLYLDGSTKASDRQLLVEEFQSNENMPVFLISLKAGGVGLTLTAADYVYLVDPWWNPAAEQQAIDRSHRIGQQNKVFAYKMICKDSVEEKILALQQRKKALAEELITEDTGFVKNMTAEDVDFLFS
ncbi:DEAD/DEAH box helicase [Paraflavitalea sp. CAU 1676]|uniref:DEAD/DEAH box helicase n=1 Tax=Paraflavitalea sp. CAU 1676 TaxID=3032598 RepID=UPI0023DA32FE|nr:DEAD/DEAH box helicase [Paraflavitalea sp. CAU 1676]MDF2191106.1 DEAD/DEAH box helicase [Paraflavitalea sp. CAU 1676]